MANVSALSAQLNRQKAECVCVIETPKNSRCKKYDEASGLFKLAYVLPEGLNFPFDFGFIPATLADDGDPLDVMVLADEPGCVGTLTDIRLIGVISAQQMEDGETKAEEVIAKIAPRPVLLHASNDSVTPTEQSVEMFKRAGQPCDLHLFADADHFMLGTGNPRIERVLKDWLAKYFPVQG